LTFSIKQKIAVFAIHLFQKYGMKEVEILGKTFLISKDVFNPKYFYTSSLMANSLDIREEDDVLDIGTGSGIQAVFAGEKAANVTAVDINPEAVKYAKINARNNKLGDRINVYQGDLFEKLSSKNKYDVIIFTPPYLDGDVNTVLDHALYDPDRKLLKRFFNQAGAYWKPGGNIQMMY